MYKMRLVIDNRLRAAVLCAGMLLVLLGTSAAAAPFAAGVDSTGWAQAQSNADGAVLIESPQYPRGLWLHWNDENGQALADLQVEYQGQPDGFVALRCVDPAGRVQETLIWTRPAGPALGWELKPRKASDALPEGIVAIDWQIYPYVEDLLEPVEETRLSGWEDVASFLQSRWHGQTGRAVVQMEATTWAVELDAPQALAALVTYLQQMQQSEDNSTALTALVVQVFSGQFGLRESAILYVPLSFADPNLEAAVRRALDKPEGSSITRQEAASMLRLSDPGNIPDIHSLADIEHLTNLQGLYLTGNAVVDLTPLSSLSNLTRLDLGSNAVVDLTPLASLTNLSSLDLRSNAIVDLTPLSSLINLDWLDLSRNAVVDLIPLSSLTDLSYLHLGNNTIVDLTPLSSLTDLADLFLRYNAIIDLTPLANLTNLIDLDLGNNAIIDLTPLADLTNLTDLDLRNNAVVDLTPLADLTNLDWLDLSDNAVVDLIPLASLTKLQWLDLGNNAIIDLTPLASLTDLTDLLLGNNAIVNLAPLASLTDLTLLYLGNNAVVDLIPLASLTKLQWLELSGNQIIDLTPLANLTDLNKLYLDRNQIEDISPLVANFGLGEEDRVYLEGNPLSDQALNEHIPALQARGVRVIY